AQRSERLYVRGRYPLQRVAESLGAHAGGPANRLVGDARIDLAREPAENPVRIALLAREPPARAGRDRSIPDAPVDAEHVASARQVGPLRLEPGQCVEQIEDDRLEFHRRAMRKRRLSAPPYAAIFVNRSRSTPPLAVITRCEGGLSSSVVRSTYVSPSAFAASSVSFSARVAYPRPRFQGTT